MIWESTLAMTIIDLVIIGAVLVSGYTFYAYRHVLRGMKIHVAVTLILLGQVVFAGLYFTDLLTMNVFPFFMSEKMAMTIMERLHFDVIWIIALVGIPFFSIGLTLLTRVLLLAKQTLEKNVAERELAEAALRESEDRYARALAGTQDGIWDWNLLKGENYYSPRWLEILGYAEGDLEASRDFFLSLIHPEDQETHSKALDAHLENRQPYHVEYRLRKKDGGDLWIRSRGQAEWNEEGTPLRMAGSISDISLRKNAEEALRESEERFRAVAENTPIPIMMSRLEDGEFLYANPAANRLMVGESGSLVGRKNTSFWMDAGKRQDLPDRIHKEEKVVDMETQLRAHDGSQHWIHSTSSEIRFHGEQVLMTGLIDVTERKKAEEALQESERQIRLITDSVPAMIAYIDADKRYQYINRQYQVWVKEDNEDNDGILGKSMEEVMGGLVFKNVEAHVEQALSGKQVSFQTEIPGPGPDKLHVLANYVPHMDQDGRTLGFYALIHDITSQKRAEEALQRWNETLEQRVAERTAELETAQEELVRKEKLATLGQLIATVGHELRNPLGTIRTSVFSIMENSFPDTLDISMPLARIDRNVTRCDHIITDLLDYTRHRSPMPSPTRINQWISELMEEQQVPEWLNLKLNLSENMTEVNLDQEYIRRAVINLYENAIQAMEDLRKESKGGKFKVTIGASIEGTWLKISVVDTGPGMSQEVLDKIFEPLFSTKTYGVGLGLPTVRQIMEQNMGTVSIKSEVGKGTEAVLKLPLDFRPEEKGVFPAP